MRPAAAFFHTAISLSLVIVPAQAFLWGQISEPYRDRRRTTMNRRSLALGEWVQDIWVSAGVGPTERGLEIELVERGRRPSAAARRLAETPRVALSTEFGEGRVGW